MSKVWVHCDSVEFECLVSRSRSTDPVLLRRYLPVKCLKTSAFLMNVNPQSGLHIVQYHFRVDDCAMRLSQVGDRHRDTLSLGPDLKSHC